MVVYEPRPSLILKDGIRLVQKQRRSSVKNAVSKGQSGAKLAKLPLVLDVTVGTLPTIGCLSPFHIWSSHQPGANRDRPCASLPVDE
jgi:hypothetical protein